MMASGNETKVVEREKIEGTSIVGTDLNTIRRHRKR